jgi:DNA polymerase epsilon subunit 1
MGLDNRCVDAVALMRRQALRLLHVREFSAAAEFREVCLALTLPDVICRWVVRWMR